jgi:hypothetical protein
MTYLALAAILLMPDPLNRRPPNQSLCNLKSLQNISGLDHKVSSFGCIDCCRREGKALIFFQTHLTYSQ